MPPQARALFQPGGPESLRLLVIPNLLLLQAMLCSLPNNVALADQAAGLLSRHAQLVRHVLLFKESSLEALDAMSGVLGIVTHVSKPPFQVCGYRVRMPCAGRTKTVLQL